VIRLGPGSGNSAKDASELLPLRVSDVKQFVYCARVVYYSYVMPIVKATTYKMEVGHEQHAALEGLENRRTLGRYGLESGAREFRVSLHSERHGLSGVLDLLITAGRDRYPVEFKDSPGGPALHHRYQLVAYCLLVEESYGAPVRSGFVYIIPRKEITEVPLTDAARERVRDILGAIRMMVRSERMPPATRRRGKCRECEYRNYCADWR
jgi:CRISPR-associated exonuclease Cas4